WPWELRLVLTNLGVTNLKVFSGCNMSLVVVTELEHIAYVKLNRPEVRNAFNPDMIGDLTRIFRDLERRQDLRAVVLQGEGKTFCAGGDLFWMKEMVKFNFVQNLADSIALFEM